MVQNRVQFQRGLSLDAFLSEYGTEEQCIAAVLAMRFPKGYECGDCGRTEHTVERKGRMFECTHCYYRTYITAGTIFQGTKLALKTWFLAMHLLTKDKQGISALQLMRELDVSYETAWTVKQKLMVVMEERVEEKKLEGDVVADDAYLGGKQSDGKRGRGSENKVPFVAAASLASNGKPDQISLRVVSGFTKDSLKDWAEKNLAQSVHLLTDALPGFPGVKEAGIEHSATSMRQDPAQKDKGCFLWINTLLGNLKTAIAGTYHHVEEKYVSRYLAEFEYRFNRRYDLKTILPRLLYAAVHTSPTPGNCLKLNAVAR